MKLSELRMRRKKNFITKKWLVRMSAAMEEMKAIVRVNHFARLSEDSSRAQVQVWVADWSCGKTSFPIQLHKSLVHFFSPRRSDFVVSVLRSFSSPEMANAQRKHFQHFRFEWFSRRNRHWAFAINQKKLETYFGVWWWWWLKTTAEN